jgi:osmotically-inducible protein OsmY
MFGRLNISALALATAFAGCALTGSALHRSAAQAPGNSGSHSDKAASSAPASGPTQQTQSVAHDAKANNKAVGPELSSPAQQGETSFAGSPVPNSELKNFIENSLKKDPTLSGTNVHVAVSEDRIELTGNVAKAKEKQTAERLALSFAGNKKLVNQISIGAPTTSQTPAERRTSPKAKPQDQRTAPSLSAQPNEAVPRPLR